MKKAILVQGAEPPKRQKEIELTHNWSTDGWDELSNKKVPKNCEKVVYLGNCSEDGDMFAVYQYGFILICKGRFNSGTY